MADQEYFEPGRTGLWRKRVAEWRASGLGSAQYCQREGLVEYQILWWAWVLDGRKGPPPVATKESKAKPPAGDPTPGLPPQLDFIPDALVPEGARMRFTQDELDYIRALQERLVELETVERGWCPQTPTEKQKEFLDKTELEVLYGGAAAGGKSSAILIAALQYVDVPGYHAIILRRTFRDLALPGAIMDRAAEWLAGTGATWDKQEKRWTFPSGATLSFGFIDNDRDKYRYASAEFAFIGFDELTQFPEGWYTFMFSRLRKPVTLNVPLRMRAASNPGGVGHRWVKKRFFDRGSRSKNRAFVGAKLEDNPHVSAEEYERSLENLDETTKAQLRNGDWTIVEGGLVLPYLDEVAVIEEAPRTTFHILAADFGYTDACAFDILGWRLHDKCVYVLEVHKLEGMTPTRSAAFMRDLDERFHFDAMIGDFGGLGKGYAEEAKERFDLPLKAAKKENKRGYLALLADAIAAGKVKIVRARCMPLLEEMDTLPWNEDRSAPEEGFEDHCCDGLLYGWREARSFLEGPEEDKPKPGTPEYYDRPDGYEKAAEERIRRRREEDYKPIDILEIYYGLEPEEYS